MEKQCNNIKCTLKNECRLAQVKSKEKVTYNQVAGDCDKFIPKSKV